MGLHLRSLYGFPTYAQTFFLTDSSISGIHAPTSSPGNTGPYKQESGILAYHEVCDFLLKGATQAWDDYQEVLYAYHDNQWVGYDDVHSFIIKAQWLKQQNFGGAMIWTLDMDDFTGSFCEQGCPHSVSETHQLNPPPDSERTGLKNISGAVDHLSSVPRE